jgi:GTP-binding protein
VKASVDAYVKTMLETWEEMPPYFVTSSEKARGRDEVLDYIEQINKSL